MIRFARTALLAAALAVPSMASAATMTFTNLADYQNYSEDGITGTSSSWWNWPAGQMAHFDGGQARLTMSGLFNATSVDYITSGGTGVALFEGYLNNVLVATQLINTGGTNSFNAGFAGIDTLRIAVTGNHFTIDNVVLDEVPEPAMIGLFGLGAIGLGLSCRRRAA